MIQTDKQFHFQARKCHITWKTFIDVEKIALLGKFRILSIAHEIGEEHEDESMPYEHTHAFIWFKDKMQTRDVRYFDIDGIHPNIKVERGMQWAKNICMKYHRGHKTKADGKKFYKAPVMLHQEGVEEWKFEEDLIHAIQAAPTLVAAVLEANVVPKTIGDVKTLRQECKRKRCELEDGLDRDAFVSIDWDRTKALVLQGPPGIGKTNWSLAQFARPQLICDLDDLKGLPEDCDGLVFDEMIFFNCRKQTQTYLCDMALTRTIRTRNTNATIPRNTPRIFCCNMGEEVFDMEQYTNLDRRVAKLVRMEPLFN